MTGFSWSHRAEGKDNFVKCDMTRNNDFVGVQVKAPISTMIVSVPEKDRWCGTRGKFVRWKGVRVTKASKRTKDFRGPLGSKQEAVGNHSLPKQQMPKFAYQKKTTSTLVSNSFYALEEDNEKHMDVLVNDTRKKMEAPPKKTSRKTVI
ncbi:hypothetical protein Tco_1257833 [Tanacetum coccineum]